MRGAPYRARRSRVFAQRLLFAVFLMVFGSLTSGCGTTQRTRNANGIDDNRFEPSPGLRQQGLASYYSNGLAGRPTASGQPYRPERFTAAHKTLPLGTEVRVTRTDASGSPQGASVVVRINDRGPRSRKRILDLSYAAARALDMLIIGVARVELEVVRPPTAVSP